jgi:DNA-binding HxlR family transcriptional regulator
MVEVPKPGQKVRGSRSGAPIMALFDLLGRRWAMGILWTLCLNGPSTFRHLQQLCETISPAVLNQRLKELQEARFVERTAHGYAPTDLGRRVQEQLVPLREIAMLWAQTLHAESKPALRGVGRKNAGG